MSAEKSIKELRAALKEKRAGTVKAPSKMKKHELLMELAGRTSRSVSPAPRPAASKKAVAPVVVPVVAPSALEKDKPAKKAPKKAAAVKESLPAKPVKDLPPANEVKPVKTASEAVKKLVAGSQEARDRMARLREMRNAKHNVD